MNIKSQSLIALFFTLFLTTSFAVYAEKTPTEMLKSTSASSEVEHNSNRTGLNSVKMINLNTATQDELVRELNGIGQAKAKSIIEYREKYGPFISINQIMEVSGVGPAIFEKNKDKLSI